uniref:uncharacterized protein LOC120338785 n=1 Tax=Styela clava TaxID=7725 RepID=UPI001939A5C9|nr:uncharacterized protein LOC120338785 [Styela clava]
MSFQVKVEPGKYSVDKKKKNITDSYLKGFNVITKYTVPTPPSERFKANHHRKVHKNAGGNLATPEPAKLSSRMSTSADDVIVISDTEEEESPRSSTILASEQGHSQGQTSMSQGHKGQVEQPLSQSSPQKLSVISAEVRKSAVWRTGPLEIPDARSKAEPMTSKKSTTVVSPLKFISKSITKPVTVATATIRVKANSKTGTITPHRKSFQNEIASPTPKQTPIAQLVPVTSDSDKTIMQSAKAVETQNAPKVATSQPPREARDFLQTTEREKRPPIRKPIICDPVKVKEDYMRMVEKTITPQKMKNSNSTSTTPLKDKYGIAYMGCSPSTKQGSENEAIKNSPGDSFLDRLQLLLDHEEKNDIRHHSAAKNHHKDDSEQRRIDSRQHSLYPYKGKDRNHNLIKSVNHDTVNISSHEGRSLNSQGQVPSTEPKNLFSSIERLKNETTMSQNDNVFLQGHLSNSQGRSDQLHSQLVKPEGQLNASISLIPHLMNKKHNYQGQENDKRSSQGQKSSFQSQIYEFSLSQGQISVSSFQTEKSALQGQKLKPSSQARKFESSSQGQKWDSQGQKFQSSSQNQKSSSRSKKFESQSQKSNSSSQGQRTSSQGQKSDSSSQGQKTLSQGQIMESQGQKWASQGQKSDSSSQVQKTLSQGRRLETQGQNSDSSSQVRKTLSQGQILESQSQKSDASYQGQKLESQDGKLESPRILPGIDRMKPYTDSKIMKTTLKRTTSNSSSEKKSSHSGSGGKRSKNLSQKDIGDKIIDDFIKEVNAKTNMNSMSRIPVFTDVSNNVPLDPPMRGSQKKLSTDENFERILNWRQKSTPKSAALNKIRQGRQNSARSSESDASDFSDFFKLSVSSRENSIETSSTAKASPESLNQKNDVFNSAKQGNDTLVPETSQISPEAPRNKTLSDKQTVSSKSCRNVSSLLENSFLPLKNQAKLERSETLLSLENPSPILKPRYRKRLLDDADISMSTPKRLRTSLDLERDEAKMSSLIDSVLLDAKKKSRERRLGDCSPLSRRALFVSPTSGAITHRSMLREGPDHPLTKMLKANAEKSLKETNSTFDSQKSNTIDENEDLIPGVISEDSVSKKKRRRNKESIMSQNRDAEDNKNDSMSQITKEILQTRDDAVTQHPATMKNISASAKDSSSVNKTANNFSKRDLRQTLREQQISSSSSAAKRSMFPQALQIASTLKEEGIILGSQVKVNLSHELKNKDRSTVIKLPQASEATLRKNVNQNNMTSNDVIKGDVIDLTLSEVDDDVIFVSQIVDETNREACETNQKDQEARGKIHKACETNNEAYGTNSNVSETDDDVYETATDNTPDRDNISKIDTITASEIVLCDKCGTIHEASLCEQGEDFVSADENLTSGKGESVNLKNSQDEFHEPVAHRSISPAEIVKSIEDIGLDMQPIDADDIFVQVSNALNEAILATEKQELDETEARKGMNSTEKSPESLLTESQKVIDQVTDALEKALEVGDEGINTDSTDFNTDAIKDKTTDTDVIQANIQTTAQKEHTMPKQIKHAMNNKTGASEDGTYAMERGTDPPIAFDNNASSEYIEDILTPEVYSQSSNSDDNLSEEISQESELIINSQNIIPEPDITTVTPEKSTQGSKLKDNSTESMFKTSMFDISQFFDDDSRSNVTDDGLFRNEELEMNDDLPEFLIEDKISAIRQKESDQLENVETDCLDELPELTETPRKRRKFMESPTLNNIERTEKMMSQLLSHSLMTRGAGDQFNQSLLESPTHDSLDGSQLIRDLDELSRAAPRSPRNPRKRNRSTETIKTLRNQRSYTAILNDTAFSRSYKHHGASLKKLVRQKKKDHEVDKMERILLSELKKGGFRETLERAERGEAGSKHTECDEDTQRAINLMKKDWGTLPRLSACSKIFRSSRLDCCHHSMVLQSWFSHKSFQALSPQTRKVVMSIKGSNVKQQLQFLSSLLSESDTRMQTYQWLLEIMPCHSNPDIIQRAIQSSLRERDFKQSPFNYSSLKTALTSSGIESRIFSSNKNTEKVIKEEPIDSSICENCLKRRRRKTSKSLMGIVKVLSTTIHVHPLTLTSHQKSDFAVFLLLLMQDEKLIHWLGDIEEMLEILIRGLKNWQSHKYTITRRLVELYPQLNVVADIAEKIRFHGDRLHELSKLISFATLRIHVFGEESRTAVLDNYADLEALVDIVDHLNPENIELLLLPDESAEPIGSQKRSYHHLSLLLPLLNICIGDECKNRTVLAVLERLSTILRTMNKRIRDNGAIYKSQVKYELSLFTKNVRLLIQKAPKKNKASIFKYLRSAPVHEEIIDNSLEQSSDSEVDVNLSYNDADDEVKGREEVKGQSLKFKKLDGDIAEVLKNKIIGMAGKR